MYQILIILIIIGVTGIFGGYAGYLTDQISSSDAGDQIKTHARKRYMFLGLISAACVPLFLSLVQSSLITNIFVTQGNGNINQIPYSEFLIFAGICLVAALSARRFLELCFTAAVAGCAPP